MGVEFQFGEMRQNISRDQISKAYCSFIIDLCFLVLILFLLQYSLEGKSPNDEPPVCGIPVLFWLEVFFCLFGVRSLFQLMKIYVISNFYSYRFQYDILRLIIIDSFMIGWLIYGNVIYYSKENNCGTNGRTALLDQFMLVILCIGYLMMAFYLVLMCTIPCLYLYIRHIALQM